MGLSPLGRFPYVRITTSTIFWWISEAKSRILSATFGAASANSQVHERWTWWEAFFMHATLWHCSHFYCYRSIMINPKFGRLYPPYFPNSPAAKVKQKQLCSKFKPLSEPPWWILGQIGFAPRKLSAWAVSATVRHKKRSSKPIRKRCHYSISLVWGMSWLWLNAYDTILWAMNRHLTLFWCEKMWIRVLISSHRANHQCNQCPWNPVRDKRSPEQPALPKRHVQSITCGRSSPSWGLKFCGKKWGFVVWKKKLRKQHNQF